MKSYSSRRRVVLLNADYSILHFVTLARALVLLVEQKVTLLDAEEKPYVHPNFNFGRPYVIVLKKYVHTPHRKVKLSRRNILLRDNYTCQYCGKEMSNDSATIDHVIPKSKFNGEKYNTWKNLVACCKSCNNKKDDKTLKASGMKLRREPFTPKLEDLITGKGFHGKVMQRAKLKVKEYLNG